MSIWEWSAEKRLLVEFRKTIQLMRRAGEAPGAVNLSPAPVPLLVQVGDKLVGDVTSRFGRRFQFGAEAVFIELDKQWVRVAYDAIVSYHWIAETANITEKVPLKREHGDRIILVDRNGERYELDGLGWAFQGLHRFFTWLLARSDKPPNQRLQPAASRVSSR